MASLIAKDDILPSCVYENSLPRGCQAIELSHISTNDSLQREDDVEDYDEELYDTVCVNPSVNNSLPQPFDRKGVSTKQEPMLTYESLQRQEAVKDDDEEHYDIVCENKSVKHPSPQPFDRKGDSSKQGTMLRSEVAHSGRMNIVVAVVGVVLVLTVIGLIISGVIVYRTLNAKIEELERERQNQHAQDDIWSQQMISLRANDSDAFASIQDTNSRLKSLDSLVQELNNRTGSSVDIVQLEIKDIKAEVSRFQDVWSNQMVSLRANDSEAFDIIQDTNMTLVTLDNLVQKLKKQLDVKSAFSVWYPRSIISGRLTFSRTILNSGGDYNISTGVFTCSKPGVYYFSVSLTKKRSSVRVDRVYCELYKNSGNIIYIFVDPTDDDTDKGSASVSNSALLDLNRGDTVSLQQCSDPSTRMEEWSSFTGFLLYADP